MAVPTRDEVLFAAGGDVWEKYGVFVRRTLPQEEGGRSFSRNSVASFRDRSLTLRETESGVLRPYWSESESEYAARLERQRTNHLLDSEDVSSSNWTTRTGTSVTTDDATAPDGTTTADFVNDTSGTDTGGVEQTITVSDDSADRCMSLFIKKDSGQTCAGQLQYSGGTSVGYNWEFDPDTGTLNTFNNAPTRSGVIDFSDSWWRVFLVGANNGTGNTNLILKFFPADDGLNNGFAVGSTGSQHIWGAQIEAAKNPSSYVQTAGSTATRNQDDLVHDYPHAPRDMTAYGKLVGRGTFITTASQRVLQISDDDGGSGTPPRLLVDNGGSGGQVRAFYEDSSGTTTASVSVSSAYGSVIEYRAELQASGLRAGVSVNGGSESVSSQSGSVTLANKWSGQKIGVNVTPGGSNAGFADHLRIRIASGTRTMQEMRDIEV